MKPTTLLAVVSIHFGLMSQALWCDDAPTVPCVYRPKQTRTNPTPEIMPHDSCARLSKSGVPSIAPGHLRAAAYVEDLAAFLIASQWYYVRPDGKALRVVGVDNGPDSWEQGLVRTLVEGKIGYADRSFQVVIPARYDWGWPFSGGRALVCSGCRRGQPEGEHTPMVGGRWGYIDLAGKEVVPVQLSRREALAMSEPRSGIE